jgi:hypothetical protein
MGEGLLALTFSFLGDMNMTWLKAAREAAKIWHLEDDVEETYWKHRNDGYPPSDAAHMACYDWDVYIPQNILDQITEEE